MTRSPQADSLVGLEPEVDEFIRALLARAAAIRLPDLFANRPDDALYWVGDRHGVSTVALRTPSLTEEQLTAILAFRLAQYLMAHQLDPRLIHARGLQHEPVANVSPGDVHIVSGVAETGELLAYITLETIDEAWSSASMSSADRRAFPVEEVFGRGIFNRLKVLPDLPAGRVCELGRFMKNHMTPALDDRMIRGPVELCVALFSLLGETLRPTFDVGIGDIEENVAKKNLDLFHVPIVVLHGVVPYAAEDSFGFFNYQHRTRYPFAFLCSDIRPSRVRAVEDALRLEGKQALAAVLRLKHDPVPFRSSLTPASGLPPLDDVPIVQEGVPMAARRQVLDAGDWLRGTTLFQDLSVAEAAVLGTFLERVQVDSGAYVVRQGEVGDDVFVIESGTADALISARDGGRLRIRSMGLRDYFGEIALIAGGERTADVVATSPLTLLRLSRADYERYLVRMSEVERDLTRTALERSQATLRALKREEP